MTLTSAPELTTLGDLAFEWRHVATAYPGEGPHWHGDLADANVRRRYHEMVIAGTIVIVTHRTPTGQAHTFAKLAAIREAAPPPDPVPEPPPQPTSDITPQKQRARGYQGVFAVPKELRPRYGLDRGWAPPSGEGDGA